MTAEGTFPKPDGAILYGSEATDQAGNFISVEAGETVAAGDVIYIHLTNGEAYVSDTGTANDIRASGMAFSGGNDGDTIVMQTSGRFVTSGLTAKQDYYLGASGAVSTTLSGVRIGTALSTTELLIEIVQDDSDAVGTVKAYLADFTGIPSNNLTAFWVVAGGAELTDAESPLNGETLPDLNADVGAVQRFLRGATSSGGTAGTETHTHSHEHELVTGGANTWGGPTETPKTDVDATAAGTLPSYYEVVFIVKIK